MTEFTININDSILELVDDEAARLGISREELLRHRIGDMFGRYKTSPLSAYPIIPPPESPELIMQKQLAIMGMLNCLSCTKKLTLRDVKSGECPSCHEPLLPE